MTNHNKELLLNNQGFIVNFSMNSSYDRVRDQVVTSITKCDGNLFKLREDLDEVHMIDNFPKNTHKYGKRCVNDVFFK